MKYYQLSKQKVLGILRRPDRIEKGIAGRGTIAVMQAVSPKIVDGKKVWKQEIWMMYEKKRATRKKIQKTVDGVVGGNTPIQNLRDRLSQTQQIRIISAWRYPGVSPKNNPIPESIFREIMEAAR